MPAKSPRSWWASLGEVFSLSQVSLIVYFVACFIFESKLESNTIPIEELVLVFLVLLACLFVWFNQQPARSKTHQLYVSKGKSFTKTCVAQVRVSANLLLTKLFGSTCIDPATQAPSTTQQATKDEEQDQPQFRTLEPPTCASKQQLRQVFLAWRHQPREFDVTYPALVDSCSCELVTQTLPAQKQSKSLLLTEKLDNFVAVANESVQMQWESLLLTETLGDSVTFANESPAYVTLQHSHTYGPINFAKTFKDSVTFAPELPAYVTLCQSRLYGPQSPIDKIPSSPLQHDEKVLPESKAIIGDIQDIAQQIHRSEPQFLMDKIPSSPLPHDEKVLFESQASEKMPTLPQLRDEKTFPRVSRTKVSRLMNKPRIC